MGNLSVPGEYFWFSTVYVDLDFIGNNRFVFVLNEQKI